MKTNRWRGRAGQSLVEMAMVLPVLAFLTFGLVDFGRAYYFQVSVTNSAREGARVGFLRSPSPSARRTTAAFRPPAVRMPAIEWTNGPPAIPRVRTTTSR
ncbi:MAG: pilus assembly protein [Chloroflexi bacterium]|nr:MAG: pilus assembly protein [Chloroflexota bacterium]